MLAIIISDAGIFNKKHHVSSLGKLVTFRIVQKLVVYQNIKVALKINSKWKQTDNKQINKV